MGTRVWAWVAALLLLLLLQGHPTDMGDEGAGPQPRGHPQLGRLRQEGESSRAPPGHDVFRDDRAYAPCTTYLVQGGHTAGCLLEGADRVLDFSIHNGSRPLLSMQRWVSDYHSCQQTPRPPWPEWPRFSLVCSLVLLLVVAPLLLALWKAQRVKKLLMPSVPDPKGSFPGLFEHHQGDFQVRPPPDPVPSQAVGSAAAQKQHGAPGSLGRGRSSEGTGLREWIADTQDVARWKKPPSGDQDTGSEQTLEVQLSGMDTMHGEERRGEEEEEEEEAYFSSRTGRPGESAFVITAGLGPHDVSVRSSCPSSKPGLGSHRPCCDIPNRCNGTCEPAA
ncbi:Cytokine receptor-like factor 2 [Fukomys damarensis]|uniref:Cytokine receptor-like factor 2 n=1 Tax=Fukomys damarensis TaxID=885580 RepID=A0A091CTJ9_FUKDA|nr:Cytokine receptor-like factor 2 [Fukomys damarensis]